MTGTATISEIANIAVIANDVDLFEGEQGGASAQYSRRVLLASDTFLSGFYRTPGDRANDAVRVADFGVQGTLGVGNAAADTAAIIAAHAAAVALGFKRLDFGCLQWLFDNTTLTWLVDNLTCYGDHAEVKFMRAGQWQLGDASHTIAFPNFYGMEFRVDSGSTADAPIYAYSVGRAVFGGCWFHDIKSSAVKLRSGVLAFDLCQGRFATGAGTSFLLSAIPTGQSGAAFWTGGRYSASDRGSRALCALTGAGTMDGCVLNSVNTGQIEKAIDFSGMASGGKLLAFKVDGGMFDQVDQQAFDFTMPAGTILGNVTIGGGAEITGYSSSAKTTGALVTLDLSSGATHLNTTFKLSDVTMDNAANRCVEVLGGTFCSVIISRLTLNGYGLRNNAASRAIYVAGTFDYLEVADNNGTSTQIRDYDIEFGSVTAAKRRIQGNRFAGTTVAAKAPLNQAARELVTEREMLLADVTYYVNPSTGSDTNAGLTSGSPFATRQKAWDTIAALDLNGHTVTVQLQDGTYSNGLTATKVPTGQGSIVFDGNSGTPANVLISTTSADCYAFPTSMSVVVTIQNQKLQTTTSGNGVNVTGRVTVNVGVIKYGAIVNSCIAATGAGAVITETGNLEHTGNFGFHASSISDGRVLLSSRQDTITGSLTMSSYVLANRGGIIQAVSRTWVNPGSLTGKRYDSSRGAIIDTGTDTGSGANASYFPGTIAGTSSPGGNYW